MFLEILTPVKKLFAGEIKLVKVPGTEGSFELMDKHAPIISTLNKGAVKVIKLDDEVQYFTVNGGVLEMKNNKVIILIEELVN